MPARRTRSRIRYATASENIYADLRYAAADDMLVKARLVTRIAQILKERGLTQIEAAKIVGLPQPKLSRLLRGQFRGFSERKLIDCLTRLGSDVRIVVVDSARRRYKGTLSVVFTTGEPRKTRAPSQAVMRLAGRLRGPKDPSRRSGFARIR